MNLEIIRNILIIALVNLFLYRDAMYYNLVNDDKSSMKINPYNVKRAKTTSIILHLIVSEYIYLTFGDIGFIAALLFSVHPFGTQIAVWWSGHMYAYNTLLALISIAFAPAGAVVWFFTNNSIPNALFIPLIFIFTKYWYLSLIFVILAIIWYQQLKWAVMVRAKKQETFTDINDYKVAKFRWTNLILVVKTFGFYSLMALLPMKNGYYNSFLVTVGSSDKETRYWHTFNRHFWGGLFAMILIFTIWLFNIYNFIGMGLLIFVLSIGPYCNFITVNMWTSPRYAYMALVGFQIALTGIIMLLPVEPRFAILGALFLFYLDRAIKTKKIYATDDITMMMLDSQVFPENPRLWYYRYEHMLHKNNPLMAWAEASYGLKYLPEDCQLWFGLAVASYQLGDMNAAKIFLENSEKYLIMTDRKNMMTIVAEMKQRIENKLMEKWVPGKRY